MAQKEYPYPVYATQGGGLVAWENGAYCFVETPEGNPGLRIGDKMPEEWGIIPANDLARNRVGEHDDVFDPDEWSRDLEEFFDRAFTMHDQGKMSFKELEGLFPEEVRERNAL